MQHTQVEKGRVWLHWWAGESHPKGLSNSSTAPRFQRSCTFAELVMAVKDDWLECWKKRKWTGLSLMGGSELQYPGTEGQNASARSHISCSRPLPSRWLCSGLCQLSTGALVKPSAKLKNLPESWHCTSPAELVHPLLSSKCPHNQGTIKDAGMLYKHCSWLSLSQLFFMFSP